MVWDRTARRGARQMLLCAGGAAWGCAVIVAAALLVAPPDAHGGFTLNSYGGSSAGAGGASAAGPFSPAPFAANSFAASSWGSRCRPRRPLPVVVATSMGPCAFNPDTLSFAGDAVQQAACLVRPVQRWAKLGPTIASLPPVFADHIGRSTDLPDRAALGALLDELGLDPEIAASLFNQVSRARDGDPFSPTARYFVIHDTSGPRLGSFPADLDENLKINNLARFRCADSFEIAHAVINRMGGVFVGHDFGVPWRSTKFERAINFAGALKGLFLHVEMIQPRRGGPGRHRNDIAAPNPGFTAAQYTELALLYTVASVRAGEWLIPAFHAVIDNDLRGGHDDPQHFEIDAFASSLEALLDRLSRHDEPVGQGAE